MAATVECGVSRKSDFLRLVGASHAVFQHDVDICLKSVL